MPPSLSLITPLSGLASQLVLGPIDAAGSRTRSGQGRPAEKQVVQRVDRVAQIQLPVVVRVGSIRTAQHGPAEEEVVQGEHTVAEVQPAVGVGVTAEEARRDWALQAKLDEKDVRFAIGEIRDPAGDDLSTVHRLLDRTCLLPRLCLRTRENLGPDHSAKWIRPGETKLQCRTWRRADRHVPAVPCPVYGREPECRGVRLGPLLFSIMVDLQQASGKVAIASRR